MSILHDIPLVFFGGERSRNTGTQCQILHRPAQSGIFYLENKSEAKLGGVSVDELIEDFGVEEYEINPYLPADPDDVERVGTEVHYLGYYLKWHPQSCYYYAQENGGFEPSRRNARRHLQ